MLILKKWIISLMLCTVLICCSVPCVEAAGDYSTVTVRVEGANCTLLPQAEVAIIDGETTLIAAIVDALEQNNVPYQLLDGDFLESINGERDWQWMLNNRGGMILPSTLLRDGDEIVMIDATIIDPVITRLSLVENSVKVGENFTVTMQKLDGNSCSAAENQPVTFAGEVKTTDAKGKVTFTAQNEGTFEIVSEPSGSLIRPRPVMITVSGGSEQFHVQTLNTPEYFELGKDADVTAEATNNSDEAQDVLLIMALYDDQNMMQNYSYSSKSVAPNTIEKLTAGFRIPMAGNYQVKAFIWENWGSIKPLSNVAVIPVQ